MRRGMKRRKGVTKPDRTYPLDKKIDTSGYRVGESISTKDRDGEPTRRTGYAIDAQILDLLTKDDLIKIIRERLGGPLDLVHWTRDADGDTIDELAIEPSDTIWDPEYEVAVDGL